jgi:putative nucleotidyltransferase with HDIG domain
MQIDKIPLRSQLGRRIFGLFVLCALVPITLLAIISFWNVNRELREQNRRDLRQVSHEEGMSIYERLTFVEANIKAVAANLNMATFSPSEAGGLPSNLSHRFRGIEIASGNGTYTLIFGEISSRFDLAPDELSYLRSGNSLVTTRTCASSAPCVFLIRRLDTTVTSDQFIVAEISAPFLLQPETVPQDKDICILDQQGRTLACSGDTPPSSFAANISRSSSGQFVWTQGGRKYEADYWNLFLKPVFFVNHWTIVASETTEHIFEPLAHFQRIFLLVVFLALLLVLLLTLIQIRRNLVPLGKLEEGTRRIAGGEFHSRVSIKSADEFEVLGQSFNLMAAQIEKQFNTLTVRSAIDRAILSSLKIDQIIDALLARMHSLLPYQQASVVLFDSSNPMLAKSRFSSGTATDKEEKTQTFTGNEVQELTAHPEIKMVGGDEQCARLLQPLASRGMRFFVVAPIVVADKLYAVLCLGHAERSIWTEEDKRLVRQIVDQVAVACSNASLLSELDELNLGALTALARTIDANSPWTAGHSERVAETALNIAREMKLPQRDLKILHRGGLLHDIGKLGIPKGILDKPGKLTALELSQMQEHVLIGHRILAPLPGFADCMPVVLQHHEWINGAGYPHGLKGDEISIHARIFAIADCYDALISDRPYRAGMPLSRVLEILQQGVGKQFDPKVMEAFLRTIPHEQSPRESETASASPQVGG